MDYNKKIETLEAKRDKLEAQLNTKGIDKEEKHDINQRIIAVDSQITALYNLLGRVRDVDHSDSRSADNSNEVVITARRMRCRLLKLNSIKDTHIKDRVRQLAQEAKVGGFVERTSKDTFTILGITPSATFGNLETFVSSIIEAFGEPNVTQYMKTEETNEKLARYHANGFKKVSNEHLITTISTSTSAELTPDDGASDMVTHVSVSSAMWKC